jgi:SPP1 gp7 family putative phage head morphogenesis protein
MKVLRPIEKKDLWAIELEEKIKQTVLKIFGPLYDFLADEKNNAKLSALESALMVGTLTYSQGVFKGDFNSRISKELQELGAKFQKGGYFLPVLPPRLQRIVQEAQKEKDDFFQKVLKVLQKNAPLIFTVLGVAEIFFKLSEKVGKAFSSTVGRDPPKEDLASQAKTFVDSVDASIRDYVEEETKTVRQMVAKAMTEGWPKAKLVEKLSARPSVTKERAKYIARQEISLATTAIKARYYVAEGMPDYVWRTKRDGKVRSDHAALDGQVFSWLNPPIVNQSKGYRRHPGEDHNCRCDALPVVEET